jgi:hypothetical protein
MTLFPWTVSVLECLLTEGERIGSDSRRKEFYAQGAVVNTAMLANQLIQPILRHYAVSVCAGVHPMVGARGLAVEGNAETYRLSIRARP